MADYVNNKKLTQELGKWAKKVRKQLKEGKPPDKIPDYIAQSIYDICTNLSYKSSFINYTFKDDMIGDAIENCVRYVKNFDYDKYNNAFAYISTIAYYAFVRRIKKENKRHVDQLLYIRKMFSEDDIRQALEADNPNDVRGYTTYIDYMRSLLDSMNIELPEEEKKKSIKKEKSGIIDQIEKGDPYD